LWSGGIEDGEAEVGLALDAHGREDIRVEAADDREEHAGDISRGSGEGSEGAAADFDVALGPDETGDGEYGEDPHPGPGCEAGGEKRLDGEGGAGDNDGERGDGVPKAAGDDGGAGFRASWVL
jgi:hypothetical protein